MHCLNNSTDHRLKTEQVMCMDLIYDGCSIKIIGKWIDFQYMLECLANIWEKMNDMHVCVNTYLNSV